jgi:ankyrin repeat protein
MRGLKFLLDVCERWSAQKLEPDDEVSGFYSFPDSVFNRAVELGRVELLGEIIKRTGAGLPLEHLVKDTGVELKVKPRYYQGLTVYGKKRYAPLNQAPLPHFVWIIDPQCRDDWATAGRVSVSRPGGTETSPLLLAAFAGQIEAVEWFLSDTPLRQYLAFAKSKAARDDVRLKHLAQAPGGFDSAISKWLNDQSEHFSTHTGLLFTRADKNKGDLVLHAAICAPPSKSATELVSYLVKTQPSLLDVRAANGATPLLLAYRLGRFDAAKILIDAGADQSTKDYGRNNLLHAALYTPPVAKKLKPMLDLLDRGTLIPMLGERNKVDQAGRTPLHQYCATVANYTYYHKEDAIRMIRLLISISPETAKQALKMLDGAGDTPLHTLLAKDADPAVVRAIIDFDQSLLCCENAVGRTPAEVAHDRYLAGNIKNPNVGWRYRADESVSTLVTASPAQFVKKETSEEPKEHEAKSTVAMNWRLCSEIMAHNGQPKRTLVSLNSANFVAQRLGEQHTKARYRVELVKKDEDDAVMSTDSQDDGSEAGDARSTEVKTDAPADKTKRRRADVISSRYSGGNYPWADPKKEKADGEKSDEHESSPSDEKKDDEEDESLYLMSPIVPEAKVVVAAGES